MSDRTFIETQFPVAKLSAEAHRERRGGVRQTLTGLGKWWGRKPLVLVRAIILGLLLPASDDPQKDMEIFLKLMSMDDEGLWRRKEREIPRPVLLKEVSAMPPSVRRRYLDERPPTLWGFDRASGDVPPKTLKRLSPSAREDLQRLVFQRLPYPEKLRYCARPEQVGGPTPGDWEEINAHLGTHARSLPELVAELGQRRFGHRPRVGDAFCGGGSVPFESARLGCDTYGSDLNPVAALLTWAAINIVGGGEQIVARIREVQEEVFRAVDEQITAWGIEHNEQGWRADTYLYCTEARCPECGWMVPLAPSWVIAEKQRVVAELIPDEENRRFEIHIREGVSKKRLKSASESGTIQNSRLHCPHCGVDTPTKVVRRGLRPWENDDLVPRPEDVCQERLYCIRWVETEPEGQRGSTSANTPPGNRCLLPGFDPLVTNDDPPEKVRRHYRAPTPEDLQREAKVLSLLRSRLPDWQAKGYLPSRRIESGRTTAHPIRKRGWTYWHHLFTPRQLLVHGLIMEHIRQVDDPSLEVRAALLLGLGKCCNWNSRLSFWQAASGTGVVTFPKQVLNTQHIFAARATPALKAPFSLGKLFPERLPPVQVTVHPHDGRANREHCDYWITDPPYADAVHYHELSEFFLAWYEKYLRHIFPDWYTDSKRALAIRGDDPVAFRQSMVAAYRNLTAHMPDHGLQVVMFTHQDAAVWADLTMILWAAGLRVTAAWSIATEINSGFRIGNYVQDTVLLICRKRTSTEPLFLDELVPRIEQAVRLQLAELRQLDRANALQLNDADYQLAAYTAALRVLTAQPIENIDPAREITRVRQAEETNPIEQLIRQAVKIACDELVPRGVDNAIWKRLDPSERFYLKGLEIESHGEYRNGIYQELARGFGVAEYTALLADTTANQTRLKTPKEFGRRNLGGDGFAGTLTRHVLFALWQAESSEEPRRGLNYLKTELPDYGVQRECILQILEYLAALRRVSGMDHWRVPAEQAEILAALVSGDHI